MALPKFGAGDPSVFASHRTDREPVVINPELLAQVAGLLQSAGIVQGQDFYTATKNDADKYNSEREQAFGDRVAAGAADAADGPKPASIAAMAVRAARKDASSLLPYIQQITDAGTFPGKTYSLRFVDQGTADHPKVLWAFVLVNARAPKSK